MQFLNGVTLQEVLNKTVGVILRTKSETVETISASTFLRDGKMFIDCVPALHRNYIVEVPVDAIVSRAMAPNLPWEFGLFVHPDSEAGRFIRSLLAAKIAGSN